jgi:MerR family transcriptional regulator, redox-sensitive transcriptional activator SoxR
MSQLTISQVARQVGLQPPAIRSYEQIGILLPAQRIGGQRRYDATVLHRLAVIQRARQTGFTLDEIRELFFGFRDAATASQRWQKLSRKNLAELAELTGQIKTMQRLLQKMMNVAIAKLWINVAREFLRKSLRKSGRIPAFESSNRTVDLYAGDVLRPPKPRHNSFQEVSLKLRHFAGIVYNR